MKKIRIISRISAIALLVLFALSILYRYTSWHENDQLTFQGFHIMYSILKTLCVLIMVFVFSTIIAKSERRSQIKRFSMIALVGAIIQLLERIYMWLVILSPVMRDFYIMEKLVIFWIRIGTVWCGQIMLSVAVLCFITLFPRKSLSFWGGLIFSVFSLLYVILEFNGFSFHINIIDAIFDIVNGISLTGMALFFYGLTSKNKQKNG